MDRGIGRINVTFGWCWLFVGVLVAMGMGLYAFEGEWLGGYTSLARRFLRLSHVAFMALSLANVLYGLCIDATALPAGLKKAGSYAMITAAVCMPAVCLLSMANGFFQLFFFIPALSFALGVFLMAIGRLRGGRT